MKKGIIFDLDGTLWDSSETVSMLWNESLSTIPEIEKRMDPATLKSLMGKTTTEIAAEFLDMLPLSQAEALIQRCCREECAYLCQHGAVLFPQLVQTLKKLQEEGYLLAIVSNCQQGYIEAFLHAHQLEHYFIDFENFGRTGRLKGENIRLVIERNGLERSIYVGDTPIDYAAAKLAGIPFVHAAYGFGKISETVPELFAFSELPAFIRPFFAE